MGNKFRRIFNPTPEEELEDLEKALNIHYEAVGKKWCATCKHWKAPPDYLPGFVEDHGSCIPGRVVDTYYSDDHINTCADYEIQDDSQDESYIKIMSRIDELRKIIESKRNQGGEHSL